jgi:2-(1,2-epoxy-1,2-dihydrophenyl)acetyl-CoA isomerase
VNEDQQVATARSGGVALVTLAKGDGLNASSLVLLDELGMVMQELAEDGSIRAVVLTGSAGAFCVGADLRSMNAGNSLPEPFDEAVEVLMKASRVTALLHRMPKVTIAAINGRCAGAGLAFACAADVRYAARSAVFNTAYLLAGRSSELGISWTLPRIVGDARARELFFFAERFDAAEAERIGLVSKVLPDEELLVYTQERADRVAGFSPMALAAMKTNLNESPIVTFSDLLRSETERYVACARGDMAHDTSSAYTPSGMACLE